MKNESVGIIILSKSRKELLLIKRKDIPVWVFPGGAVEKGEDPKLAAIRETFEETGLDVKITRKVATYLKTNIFTSHTHFYECIALSDELKLSNETSDIDFFPLDNLPPLPPPYPEWLSDALQNCSEPLEKPLKSVTYANFFKNLILHPILVFRFLLTKIGIHVQ